MTTPNLVCNGRRLALGRKVGRGGEGEVYLVADGSGRAVKIYHQPDADREVKVQALVRARFGEICPGAAFPLEVVHHSDRRFAGFTMRHVAGHQPIHELMSPGSRRELFPDADWRFLVRTAINVARSVASVHAAGVVIGDINGSGFLVSKEALVTLIDTDSFQAGAYRCRVGMPEYTPPELQGRTLDKVDRTVDHDAFGLAVIVFQLLVLGRHPHAGVPRGRTITLDKAIASERFTFSLIRDVGASPPPAVLRLDDLPRGIRLLFERAFARRSGPRPTGSEWIAELSYLEVGLTACPRQPHHHVAGPDKICPWCRIERATGRTAFQTAAPRSPPAVQPDTDLHRNLRLAVRNSKERANERIGPVFYRSDARPSIAAKQLLLRKRRSPEEARAKLIAKIVADASGPAAEFVVRFSVANLAATSAVETWRKQLGVPDVYKLTDRLEQDLARLDTFKRRRSDVLAREVAKLVTAEAMVRLRDEKIAGAALPGLGEALRRRLIAMGIETAADITRPAVEAVPTLGPARALALLFWSEQLAVHAERSVMREAGFMTRAKAHVAERLEHAIMQSEAAIRHGIADLGQRVNLVVAGARREDPTLTAALVRRDQAQVDLAYLGIEPITALKALALKASPVAPPSPGPTARKSPPKMACPRCGSPMVKRWTPSGRPGAALFLGCSRYPGCRGSRPVRKAKTSP